MPHFAASLPPNSAGAAAAPPPSRRNPPAKCDIQLPESNFQTHSGAFQVIPGCIKGIIKCFPAFVNKSALKTPLNLHTFCLCSIFLLPWPVTEPRDRPLPPLRRCKAGTVSCRSFRDRTSSPGARDGGFHRFNGHLRLGLLRQSFHRRRFRRQRLHGQRGGRKGGRRRRSGHRSPCCRRSPRCCRSLAGRLAGLGIFCSRQIIAYHRHACIDIFEQSLGRPIGILIQPWEPFVL